MMVWRSALLLALAVAVPLLAGCAAPADRPFGGEAGFLALFGATGRGIGSAVVLADGMAVTSAHVVAGRPEVAVRARDGRAARALVAAVSPRLDLALLEIPPGLGSPVRMAARPAARGQGVWAMGNAPGIPPVASASVAVPVGYAVSRQRPGRRDRGFFAVGAGGPGYSGGPVVDEEGGLLGVVQGGLVGWAGADGPALDGPVLFAYHAEDVLAEVAGLIRTISEATPPRR